MPGKKAAHSISIRSGTLTVNQAARKFELHPDTVRRLLRQGRIIGTKVAGRGGLKWLVSANAAVQPALPKGRATWLTRELKRIYKSSARLTTNVERSQIREMIRRGFFSNGIWLDEFDKVESVAKEIVNKRERSGRTPLETDPEL